MAQFLQMLYSRSLLSVQRRVLQGNGDLRGTPIGTYPTTDGWIAMVSVGEVVFERMVELIGREELARRYEDSRSRAEHREEIDPNRTPLDTLKVIVDTLHAKG